MILLFTANLAFGQDAARISGEIAGAPDGMVSFYPSPDLIGGGIKTDFPLKKEKFSARIDLTEGRFVPFQLGNESFELYLEPGDELEMKFSAGKMESTLSFSGKGSAHNNYLRELAVEFGNDFATVDTSAALKEKAIDLVEFDLFEKKMRQANFLKEHPMKKEFSPAFAGFAEKMIRYNYLNKLLLWSQIQGNYPKKLVIRELPRVMTDEMSAATFQDVAALPLPQYRTYIDRVMVYFAADSNKFKEFPEVSAQMYRLEKVSRSLLAEPLYQYYLANLLVTQCERATPEMATKLFGRLTFSDKSGKYVETVRAACGEHMAKKTEEEEVKKEKPAKDDGNYTLIDMNGKKTRLSDFTGKVVYVDFWASWCGPCRQQFPYAKQLKETLSKKELKEVVFLYISIDKDEDTWKRSVEQIGLEGTHVFSPGGWNASAATFFKVTSIPRYMLIDKKGKIVQPRATRPSQPETLTEIRKLLQE